jgi:hypothetical protein
MVLKHDKNKKKSFGFLPNKSEATEVNNNID